MVADDLRGDPSTHGRARDGRDASEAGAPWLRGQPV